MRRDIIAFRMTLAGTACWAVCFLWMHRISAKQNCLLEQLRQQGKRIEKLSKIEHDLIKEVHPQVSEIKEGGGRDDRDSEGKRREQSSVEAAPISLMARAMTVAVDAGTNLANPAWIPLATNTLPRGSLYFAGPRWPAYPSRFSRLRRP